MSSRADDSEVSWLRDFNMFMSAGAGAGISLVYQLGSESASSREEGGQTNDWRMAEAEALRKRECECHDQGFDI